MRMQPSRKRPGSSTGLFWCLRLRGPARFAIILAMTYNRLVLTTAGSPSEARKIARALVEQRLAACVNIIPQIESIYRWRDQVETAREYLLVIKTSQRRYQAVEKAIRELHSYELPECLSVAIESGSKDYLKWLAEQVK